jgi:hypothetical protein
MVQCGIAGTQIETNMANVVDLPDGTQRFEFWDKWTFASALTEKSIESFAAEQMTTNIELIDNDGTISFFVTFKSLEQRLKLPNGDGPRARRGSNYVHVDLRCQRRLRLLRR